MSAQFAFVLGVCASFLGLLSWYAIRHVTLLRKDLRAYAAEHRDIKVRLTALRSSVAAEASQRLRETRGIRDDLRTLIETYRGADTTGGVVLSLDGSRVGYATGETEAEDVASEIIIPTAWDRLTSEQEP